MTIQVERGNKPEIILKLNSLLLAYFTSVGFGFQIPAHFLPPELNGLLYRNCVKAINEPNKHGTVVLHTVLLNSLYTHFLARASALKPPFRRSTGNNVSGLYFRQYF